MSITIGFKEAHDVSLAILASLSEEEVEQVTGMIGVALTLGRLSAPKVLTSEEEVAFTQALLDWTGMYWGNGKEAS